MLQFFLTLLSSPFLTSFITPSRTATFCSLACDGRPSPEGFGGFEGRPTVRLALRKPLGTAVAIRDDDKAAVATPAASASVSADAASAAVPY